MGAIKVEYFRKNSSLGRKTAVFLIVLLFGCGGQEARSTSVLPFPTNGKAIDSFPLSPVWTETATAFLPSAPTLSPTATATQAKRPTRTETLPPTQPALPTARPTPTLGLLPSATLGPAETCPPPTYAKVNIHFAQNIRDYGSEILEYIRANGDRAGLEKQFEKFGGNDEEVNKITGKSEAVFIPDRIYFTEADVNGDLSKEIIITIKQISIISSWLDDIGIFVVGCRGNQFQLLDSGNELFYDIGTVRTGSGILAIRDLNANGIPEIVVTGGYIPGMGEVDYGTIVLEWNGSAFRSLIYPIAEDPGSWGNRSLDQLPSFKDMDGNGTTELLLPWYVPLSYCDDLPVTPWSGVYMWDGVYFRFMWTDLGDPTYRFQAAFNGDYYSNIALYDRSEAMYRRTIIDSSLKSFYSLDWGKKNNRDWCDGKPHEPEEPQRIIAYARFRLLELLVYLQKMDAAESDWAYITANYPETAIGYPYASLAKTFWDAYQNGKNIDEACTEVRDLASKDSDDILEPLKYGEGLIQGPTLDTICRFHSDAGGG